MKAMNDNPRSPASKPAQANLEAFAEQRILYSYELFGNHNEIIINHQGDQYRLRITSNQKLILTK
ncbi:MAG: hemin uptake protein HemP [Methylococcales bacterium]